MKTKLEEAEEEWEIKSKTFTKGKQKKIDSKKKYLEVWYSIHLKNCEKHYPPPKSVGFWSRKSICPVCGGKINWFHYPSSMIYANDRSLPSKIYHVLFHSSYITIVVINIAKCKECGYRYAMQESSTQQTTMYDG